MMSSSIGRKRPALRMAAAAAAACAASAVAPCALGNNDTWKAATSGTWGQHASWTDNSVPGSNDQATFNLAGTYSANFNAVAAPIQDLFVLNSGTNVRFQSSFLGPYTLNVTSATGGRDATISGGATLTLGGTSDVTITALHLNVGDDLVVGAGSTLNVTKGSQATASDLFLVGALNVHATSSATFGTASVGASAGTAAILVAGAGAQWNATGELQLGSSGSGSLNVSSGGSAQSASARFGVAAAGARGDVFVSGSGSQWTNLGSLLVGDSGIGFLTIQDGGVVHNTGPLVQLGSKAGSQGHVLVSGAGSELILSSGIDVGTSGRASMRILDGGLVRSGFGILARNSGLPDVVTVEVSGANSLWDITSGLTVGGNDQARLTITDGGEVRGHGLNDFTISNFSTVTVDGAGSKWNTSNFFAIRGGTLNITNGGEARHSSGNLGATAGGIGEGVVNVEGANSKWILSNSISVGTSSGSGTLNIGPGGTVTAGGFLLLGTFASSTTTSTGTLNLNGGELAVQGVTFEDTSVVNFNAGTFRFNADAALGDPVMDKLLGQAHAIAGPQHLAVNGAATLNTSLIIDGGTFSAGQLVNPQLLHLSRGTLNLTNQAVVIEPGGALGESLDLPAGVTINVALGLTNRRLVTGDGQLGGPFHNDTGGEVRADPGDSLTFTGAGNTNDGQIRLFGGLVVFAQDLGNHAGGAIVGTGTIITGAGLTNAGAITFSGAANVAGDLTNAVGGSVLATGGNTVTFFDDVQNDGTITVRQGTTAVFLGHVINTGTFAGSGTKYFEGGSTGTLGAVSTSGGTVVEAGASVTAQHLRESLLVVHGIAQILPGGGAGSGTSRVAELDVTGQLDLSDNKLIVVGGDVGSSSGTTYSGLTGMIQSGAIYTSQPDAVSGLTALGIKVAESSGTFGGLSVAAGDVLIMYTYGGDANLDGLISGDDYTAIDFAIAVPGASGWANGDFNLDGIISGDDYTVIDFNIAAQGAAFPTGGALAVVAVPEPGVALLAAVPLGIVALRRPTRGRSHDCRTRSG